MLYRFLPTSATVIGHRSEVSSMLLTEYDEAETMEMFREEGREEGHEQGREEGLEQGREEGREEGLKQGHTEAVRENLQSLMQTLNLTIEQAMDALQIPTDQRAGLDRP